MCRGIETKTCLGLEVLNLSMLPYGSTLDDPLNGKHLNGSFSYLVFFILGFVDTILNGNNSFEQMTDFGGDAEFFILQVRKCTQRKKCMSGALYQLGIVNLITFII